MHDSLFGALGLFTILIGLSNALATKNPLILLGALLIGTVIGEALNIDAGLRALGDFFQRRLNGMGSTVSEAFVTSSLVFCVGPLTILGSLDNGLVGRPDEAGHQVHAGWLRGAGVRRDARLGRAALGLHYSDLPGRDQPGRGTLAPVLGSGSEALIELTATGGLILIAIGLRLLKIRELRTANFLPALVVAPLLVGAVALWQMYANGTSRPYVLSLLTVWPVSIDGGGWRRYTPSDNRIR